MPTVGSPVPAKQGLSTPSFILFVFNSLYQASQVLAIAQLTGNELLHQETTVSQADDRELLKGGAHMSVRPRNI